jgi:peptidylprolyl isomerase/peptidyl-prolyl cis-trans isomerase B (cyclophilin B)
MRLIAAAFLLFAAPAFAQDANPPPPADAQPAPAAVAVVPALTNPAMTGPRLLIATAMGDITLQLDSAHAPKSVANILKWVKAKHYDGTVVYRVAKGFVIQMGSWEAHMKGRGYKPVPVPLEADNGLHNLRGTVALARAEAPDSAGPEFFISVADNTAALDHKAGDAGNTTGYAVFGEVTSGMEVVDAINAVPVGDDGPMPGQAPVDPILVKKITLLK